MKWEEEPQMKWKKEHSMRDLFMQEITPNFTCPYCETWIPAGSALAYSCTKCGLQMCCHCYSRMRLCEECLESRNSTGGDKELITHQVCKDCFDPHRCCACGTYVSDWEHYEDPDWEPAFDPDLYGEDEETSHRCSY